MFRIYPGKYYEAYEERYRLVYAQGADYWTADPDELCAAIDILEEFLRHFSLAPSKTSIVEFGCGEGFLGKHLLSEGYFYLGIDLSPSALSKARALIPGKKSSFISGDITNLCQIPSGSYDAGLDNFCFHMLITDQDRKNYLSEMRRVLKAGSCVCLHEIMQSERFTDSIGSLQDFLARHPVDLETCEARRVHTKDEILTIQLPRLPARFNSPEGYREELEHAGFRIERIAVSEGKIVIFASS